MGFRGLGPRVQGGSYLRVVFWALNFGVAVEFRCVRRSSGCFSLFGLLGCFGFAV